jgi:hypothetical protein
MERAYHDERVRKIRSDLGLPNELIIRDEKATNPVTPKAWVTVTAMTNEGRNG